MSFKYGKLRDAIVAAVRKDVEDKDIGVAFSGGLDSGLVAAIAKKYARSVTLYTCGTDKAFDVVMAKDLSERLDLPWVHAAISKRNMEIRIRDFIAATGVSDPFTISYEMPLFCVCMESKESLILSGQGSDEYFMGCAKFVDQPDHDYESMKDASVERLLTVSVPCEKMIIGHFGKTISYPYLDPIVISEIDKLDPADLRPKDMDSRKSVLRDIAEDLGYPVIAGRQKKSSQYGSGTTDIIRAIAREKGMMYNQYIASVYDSVTSGTTPTERGSLVSVRMDSVIKAKAEEILRKNGMSPSEAMEIVYRRIIEDDGVGSLKK